MNYNEFVDALGLILDKAKEQRDELKRLAEKTELAFKITLIPVVAFPLSLIFANFSKLLTSVCVIVMFFAPIVGLIVGSSKRLWKGVLDFTVKGLNLIPIFPINIAFAMGALILILWVYIGFTFAVFWKMKKDIKFDLEVAEDVVKDLEAKEK